MTQNAVHFIPYLLSLIGCGGVAAGASKEHVICGMREYAVCVCGYLKDLGEWVWDPELARCVHLVAYSPCCLASGWAGVTCKNWLHRAFLFLLRLYHPKEK